jgi:hypothetical protein
MKERGKIYVHEEGMRLGAPMRCSALIRAWHALTPYNAQLQLQPGSLKPKHSLLGHISSLVFITIKVEEYLRMSASASAWSEVFEVVIVPPAPARLKGTQCTGSLPEEEMPTSSRQSQGLCPLLLPVSLCRKGRRRLVWYWCCSCA